jgi:hypothetical protein
MTARLLIPVLFACSAVAGPTAADAVSGNYRFTTPQTAQSMAEAATTVKVVGALAQTSSDLSTSTLTFSGSVEGVALAEWVLPQIDKATGDGALHEYRLPSGDIARVVFVPNAATPQEMQERLTILRTVADVQKVYAINWNHAFIVRGAEWEVLFSQWIIDQLNQPAGQKPDTTPREFTVGGPDFRGMGHGARLNFLANITSPQQQQELLTVLRTVGDIMKVFSYTSSHALVLRAGDTDLQRAEWLIQQLDLPAERPAGTGTFAAPAGDDVTRVFTIPNATPQWLQLALTTVRSELNVKKAFSTTSPGSIIVRGTTDQVAAAAAWMASHNALSE